MKHLEQLETVLRTLDADRDKLIVYNLLGTVYATFRGYKEWKLRLVNDVWTVVQERSLYRAVYPLPEYIPPTLPADTCAYCGGAGELAVEVRAVNRLYNLSSTSVTYDTCHYCNGTGSSATPATHVASDRDIHDMQLLHEAVA